MNNPLIVYLAGPIRDGHAEDIEWREYVLRQLKGKATFVNPLGAKKYYDAHRLWTVSGQLPNATSLARQDSWCVDRADIVLANLTALSKGYPAIGTLLELGRAWARRKLIYLILSPRYKGHENHMFELHPFLADIAAGRFIDERRAVEVLKRHLPALSGANPHFDGVVA